MVKAAGPLGGGSKAVLKSKPLGMLGLEPARRVGNAIKQVRAAPGVLGEARDKAVSSNPITRGIRDVSRKALGLPAAQQAKDTQRIQEKIKTPSSSFKPIQSSMKKMAPAKVSPQAPSGGPKPPSPPKGVRGL
jgi:hypothetical protein